MNEVVLAKIDLSGCPEGIVFDPTDSDWSIEEAYFPKWECPLASIGRQRPSLLRVVEEDGKPVLDHYSQPDRCLVTGDVLWGDYTVEAYVRQITAFSQPSLDDYHSFVGRSGLMFRYRSLRQYYFLCIEGYDRIVLYRREHANYHVLDEIAVGIDRSSYHHLKVECRGTLITCFFDDERCMVVDDDVYKTGRAGIRTCTRARFYDIRVAATESQHATFVDTRSRAEKDVAAEREKYPKMVAWKEIDTEAFGGGPSVFGDVRGSGQTELLLLQDPSEPDDVPRIKVLNLDGEQVWEQDYPHLKTLSKKLTIMEDIDGDGVQELVSASGDRISITNAVTGELKAEAPLPECGPFLGPRGTRLTEAYLNSCGALYACNLRGHPGPQDLILRDGMPGASGATIWAYDHDLNLMWRQHTDGPWYGMYIWFWDVDGDGRDEVLPGYDLYDDDGSLLWHMEGAVYHELMGEHVDHAAFGELDGDEENGPEVGMAASSEGFILVDARNGAVLRRHRVGHAQGVHAGNFRPDLPGLEMWVGDRWDTYGVMTLFSGTGEQLFSFEPDNICEGGPAVNWTGDGQELMLLSSSLQTLGMYDAYGRKVVVFPEDAPTAQPGQPYWPYRGQARPLDLTGDARDEIVLTHEGKLLIYSQDTPYPKGKEIYAPIRRRDISCPNWKVNDADT